METNQVGNMAEKYDVGQGHVFANLCIFVIPLMLVLVFLRQLKAVARI